MPTPARTLSISGVESRVLKLSFLSLKMMVKSGLEFIIHRAPSEIPAKLSGQFTHSDIFALGSSDSEGAR